MGGVIGRGKGKGREGIREGVKEKVLKAFEGKRVKEKESARRGEI